MSLIILNGDDVRSLLLSLNRSEILEIQSTIAKVLQEYSIGNQRPGDELDSQAQRQTVVRRQDGLDSVLMPLVSGEDTGFEVMNVPEDKGKRRRSRPVSWSFPRKTSNPGSSRNSIASTLSDPGSSSSILSPKTTGVSGPSAVNFGPTVDNENVQDFKSGYLTITDAFGMPTALINTQDLIPFRSALCSLLLFDRRRNVEDITVFGAGRLAFWHIYLALLLRGNQIKNVNILNRSFGRASQLLKDIYSPAQAQWRSDVKFAAVSPGFRDYDQDLMNGVAKADVIFCCTSSENPLFPAEYLFPTTPAGSKGRLISAAGSCRPNMVELDPRILKDATEIHRTHNSQSQVLSRGVVVVDTLESCLQNAGEIVQAGLDPLCLVEVGELIMADNFAERGKMSDKKLLDWIKEGDVVYKSVGLGMLDLVLGKEICNRAIQKRIGNTVPAL